MVGGQSRARVHSAALQYQAHGQVLQHTDSVSAVDINWWRARELMAPLFAGDEDELQGLIRDHMILPYLFGDFRPSHIQEYAGGLLLTLEQPAKDGGGIRPIICCESRRRCFANLAANAVRVPFSRFFTSR